MGNCEKQVERHKTTRTGPLLSISSLESALDEPISPDNQTLESESPGLAETLQRFLVGAFEQSDIPSSPNGTVLKTLLEPLAPESDDISNESVRAQVSARDGLIATSRARLQKRQEELRHNVAVSKNGPQGEVRSSVLVQRVELVPLDLIVPDESFENLRLKAAEEELLELSESMRHEGLKVPVTLIEIGKGSDGFHARAGFRRIEVAKRLKWQQIPAVILPANTPVIEEYWTNIIENSARSRLSTYEIASAAKTMRGKFGIKASEFAIRAGYSETYVQNLLRCLDRLPETIIEEWKGRAPIPVDLYIKWSIMNHEEAIKMMLIYTGRNPHVVKNWEPAIKHDRAREIKMSSARGLARMQRVRFALEVAKSLDHKTRELGVKIVDFCSGARDDVPGVFELRSKQRRYKSRRRQDLLMPAEGESLPLPDLTETS
jgi:ParB/RepB/Spo0J family partition protein